MIRAWQVAVVFLCLIVYADQTKTEEIFTHIYDAGIWGQDQEGKGTSGSGSLIKHNWEYVAFLNKFIQRKEIKSIVDIGCGDWQIMRHVDLGDADYLGIDVVEDVLNSNKEKYSSSHVRFAFADAIHSDLPAADLLLCKDVIIHFPNEDIFKFMKQFEKYKHVLITTDIDPETFTALNRNIRLGEWRRVDLSAAPFFQKGKRLLIYPAESYQHFKLVFYIQNF